MSGRYRYEPSNGWLWILPPVGPSFASVYEKSASGADSNTRAVREIVIELNRLLDRAVYAESHRLTAETALDEAIARADKASNALIRTTAALRETTDRAEKAEARVAELERDVAAWSPARHYGEEDETRASDCPIHGPEHTVPSRWTNGPLAPVRFICMKCSWVWEDPGTAKTAPQTPVPAPEGTAQSPGPGRSDPRASESSNLDTKRRATTCEDVKCPCVEEHGPVTLTDEDRVDLTKPQTLRAYATFGEASPENSIRILVDPAAAAEVEARTGAYVTRSAGVVTVTAIDGVIVEVRHPRAGLPSRDEVAAFLDGLVPRNEPKAEPERPCVRCRKGLPPDRAWFHAECMNPRVNP